MNKKNFSLNLGISLNTVILIFSIFTLMPDITKKQSIYTFLCVIIIFLQLISIADGIWYQNIVEKMVFNNISKKALLNKIKPFSQTGSLQGARDELRYGLNILTVASIFCCLFWVLTTKDVLKFIICVGIISLTYIYADYIPHAKNYAKHYDSFTLNKGEVANSTRGLAKIYFEEYKLTKFNRHNALYAKLLEVDDLERSSNNAKIIKQQDTCIKNILFMKADSIKCPDIVYSIIITFFNILLVVPNAMDIAISNVLNNTALDITTILPYVLVCVNVIFSTINLVTLLKYEKDCEKIWKICCAIEGDVKSRLNIYNNLKSDTVNYSRGIFVFCSSYIDNGISLDNIDIKYRMLFIHRFYANIPRFWISVKLIYLILFCLLLDINANWKIILTTYIILSILTLFFRFVILPLIGKWKIGKICKKWMKTIN